MNKMSTCLWFDKEAEEAANFYCSIFNGKIGDIAYYGENMPGPAGTVLTVTFQINGEEFVALNGGPIFKFSEAFSLTVYCDTQEELDTYWKKLSAVPESEMCGWVKDKYGLSWQIVPSIMRELMADKTKADRVMHAVLKMKKLDIAAIKRAADGN